MSGIYYFEMAEQEEDGGDGPKLLFPRVTRQNWRERLKRKSDTGATARLQRENWEKGEKVGFFQILLPSLNSLFPFPSANLLFCRAFEV